MILAGDCRERLAELADGSVHTVITSPPYFGLRDYGTGEWEGGDSGCDHMAPMPGGTAASGLSKYANGLTDSTIAARVGRQRQQYRGRCARCGAHRVDRQVGLEATPDDFVAALVDVFRQVRRVLRDDGTVWLNLGDSYAAKPRGSDEGWATSRLTNPGRLQKAQGASLRNGGDRHRGKSTGLKEKDLIGIPWMVAFALRADGWYLRSEIVWAKPNPMPESVTDRPTSSHEKLFMLSKAPSYFYDAAAIRETGTGRTSSGILGDRDGNHQPNDRSAFATSIPWENPQGGRNKRNVWTVATAPFADAHFATFPPALIEPCVLAGAPPAACSSCGAPHERIVEGGESTWAARKAAGATWGNVENPAANGGTQRVVHGQGVSRDLTPTPGLTVGFAPSCGCGAPSTAAVVLDPFAGSGTVGVVCGWHGREFIGCELNPTYAEMAERRIASEGRLGRRAYRPEPAQLDALF